MAAPFDLLVLGGGIAGIGAAVAAARAGARAAVLEAEPEVGGLARPRRAGALRLDLGPHFVTRGLAAEAGVLDRCVAVVTHEAVHYRGRFRRFPFGLLREPSLVVSVAGAMARRALRPPPPAASLRAYLRDAFGDGFARRVAEPLMEKWAGQGAAALAPEMAGRLDPPSLEVLLTHARILLTGHSRQLERDGGDVWMYPRGGAADVCDGLCARYGLEVHPVTPVERVVVENGRAAAVVAGGREWRARAIVSTLPRAILAGLLPFAPAPARLAPLPTRAITLVAAVVDRPRVTPWSWAWFPEPRFAFYRVAAPANTLPELVPQGRDLLVAEIAGDIGDPTWRMGDAALAALVWPQLAEAFGVPATGLVESAVVRVPFAYAVQRAAERAAWADPHAAPLAGLWQAGRFGAHRHWLMHDAYASGQEAARRALRATAAGRSD